jgi:hypothetical protein
MLMPVPTPIPHDVAEGSVVRGIAIRRVAPSEVALTATGSAPLPLAGVWVGRGDHLPSSPDYSWTALGADSGAKSPTIIVGEPEVTGGNRHGCQTPARHVWYERLSLGELMVGSLPFGDSSGALFREARFPDERMLVRTAGTASSAIVYLGEDRIPRVWNPLGGPPADTTAPDGDRVTATRLAGGRILVGTYRVGDVGIALASLDCRSTCNPGACLSTRWGWPATRRSKRCPRRGQWG